MTDRRFQRDPARPCFVISVAAGIVQAHPRTLRIYEEEGLLSPARTPTNIRLYSENDIRRILWIRRLTQERGVNLAGVKLIFDLEERLGTRILEALFDDERAREAGAAAATRPQTPPVPPSSSEYTDTDGPGAADALEETRAATRAQAEAVPTARPITHIAVTRVTTNRGEPND